MLKKVNKRGTDSFQLIVLFFVAGLAPLVFLTDTLDPVMIPRMLLLSLLTLVLTILLYPAIRQKSEAAGKEIFRRRIFTFAIILFALNAASCLKSQLPGESIFELLKGLIPFLFLAPCSLFFCRSPKAIAPLARLISVVALCLSIIGLGQFYGLAFLWIPGNIAPYATMANKNLLSSYLFLSLPWSFIAFGGSSRFWRLASILSISTVLLLIALSRTRAVWVAVVLAALLALLLLLMMDRQSIRRGTRELYITRRTLLGSAAWLILLTGSIYAADALSRSGSLLKLLDPDAESTAPPPGRENLLERAESVFEARDPSVKNRLLIWSKSLEMTFRDPLLGVGPGQWRVHIAGYGTEGMRSASGITHFQRPHNDYLWIAAESGVLALLFYIAFLVTGLVYCLKLMFASSDRHERLWALLLFSGMIGFVAISFFSYPKERLVHMTYLMLMTGLAVSLYHRRNPMPQRRGPRLVPIAWPVIATLSLASAALALSRIESEKHINLAYQHQDRSSWAAMIGEIDKAQTVFTPMDPTATPLAWYRGIANSALNRNQDAFEDFSNAYQVNSNHLHVLTNLGTVYEMKEDHKNAITYYKKALKISPGFKDAALNLTAVYYNSGQYQEAYETISTVKHPDDDPRYQLYFERVQEHFSEDSTATIKEKR